MVTDWMGVVTSIKAALSQELTLQLLDPDDNMESLHSSKIFCQWPNPVEAGILAYPSKRFPTGEAIGVYTGCNKVVTVVNVAVFHN